MQLYPNQFNQKVNSQPLAPFYLIFGDEPLQKMECIDLIRAKALNDGAEERINLTADTSFSWLDLVDEFQAMSLFSSKKLIELELPTAKPGKEGSETLKKLVAMENPDIILVVHGPKLEQAQQKSKWFKALDKQSVFVPCFPVEGQQLHRWIQQRLNNEGLQSSADAIGVLADFCEGNLLAASQEISKLSLQFKGKFIDTEQVQENVVNQSRFNVFQLVEHLLVGNMEKAVAVMERLESESLEPTIVLWAMQREAFTLIELQTETSQGANLNSLWNKHRIWKSRQAGYQAALHRLNANALDAILAELTELDSQIKSAVPVKPYVQLTHICMMFKYFEQLKPYQLA